MSNPVNPYKGFTGFFFYLNVVNYSENKIRYRIFIMDKDKIIRNDDIDEEEKIDIKAEVISWIKMIVTVVVVVLFLNQVILINARVPSGSMEQTIMTGDRLIGFRFSYWFNDPDRGDIVLFKYPVDGKTIYIKRVIGLPGETVTISDGSVYIDGQEQPLDEGYINGEWYMDNDGMEFVVPEDSYFVMGDNRNNSADGRYWATLAIQQGVASDWDDAQNYSYVPRKNIKAKAIFRYFGKPGIIR